MCVVLLHSKLSFLFMFYLCFLNKKMSDHIFILNLLKTHSVSCQLAIWASLCVGRFVSLGKFTHGNPKFLLFKLSDGHPESFIFCIMVHKTLLMFSHSSVLVLCMGICLCLLWYFLFVLRYLQVNLTHPSMPPVTTDLALDRTKTKVHIMSDTETFLN